jgi:hypothetical protein
MGACAAYRLKDGFPHEGRGSFARRPGAVEDRLPFGVCRPEREPRHSDRPSATPDRLRCLSSLRHRILLRLARVGAQGTGSLAAGVVGDERMPAEDDAPRPGPRLSGGSRAACWPSDLNTSPTGRACVCPRCAHWPWSPVATESRAVGGRCDRGILAARATRPNYASRVASNEGHIERLCYAKRSPMKRLLMVC